MNNYRKARFISTIVLGTILFSTITACSPSETETSQTQTEITEETEPTVVEENVTTVVEGESEPTVEGESVVTVKGSNCRQVNTENVSVVSEPTGGEVVGTFNKGQQVIIANEGYDGWVPIESPASVYIKSEYLSDC